MKRISPFLALGACFFMCSCASQQPFYEPQGDKIINGCLLDAVNCQAEQFRNRNLNAKILMLRFKDYAGHIRGHAMCVVKSKDGMVYAYDRRGYFKIKGNGENPVEVAEQVFKDVTIAWYEK